MDYKYFWDKIISECLVLGFRIRIWPSGGALTSFAADYPGISWLIWSPMLGKSTPRERICGRDACWGDTDDRIMKIRGRTKKRGSEESHWRGRTGEEGKWKVIVFIGVKLLVDGRETGRWSHIPEPWCPICVCAVMYKTSVCPEG